MEGFTKVKGFNDSTPNLMKRVSNAKADANESYALEDESGKPYVISKKHLEEARTLELVTFLVKDSDQSEWIMGPFKEVGERGYIRVIGVPERTKFSVRG
jgi:hypothetical protein